MRPAGAHPPTAPGRLRASRALSRLARILAVADEVDETLYGARLDAIRPDLVVSCGDLPFEYLEHLVSRLDVPLVYVPGNHDPSLKRPDSTWMPLTVSVPEPGPAGCSCIDGRVVDIAGIRIAGLGGSLRYRAGPNQYTPARMHLRAAALALRISLAQARHGRGLDILVTHAPPFEEGGGVADRVHQGFAAFNGLLRRFAPRFALHGHVHPYGRAVPERRAGETRIINVVPSLIIEL